MPNRWRSSLGLALALAVGGATPASGERLCGPFDPEASVRAARELARPGESLLALPKDPDGRLPGDYELGPGAHIASSFFSPVLCATVARVVGPPGVGPSELVPRLPATAALVPHSVYFTAGSGCVQGPPRAVALREAGDDPHRGLQYALDQIGVERIWRVKDATRVTVADALDSAPGPAHRELSGVRSARCEGGYGIRTLLAPRPTSCGAAAAAAVTRRVCPVRSGILNTGLVVVAEENPDPDWSLVVRLSGVVVGHIRRHPTSVTYSYTRRLKNEVEPLYEDWDLVNLIRRVARRP